MLVLETCVAGNGRHNGILRGTYHQIDAPSPFFKTSKGRSRDRPFDSYRLASAYLQDSICLRAAEMPDSE